jgi:alpha-tubulin suppressor-like RCC1 family protein
MTSRSSAALATLILLAALIGCRDDAESPTAPQPQAGVTSNSTPLVFRDVSAGEEQSCGVAMDDRVYCWGDNLSPVAVGGALKFRQVSTRAKDGHTCAVTTDDHAYCWGHNWFGELGDGTTIERPAPVAVAGGRRFRYVTVGLYHTCAVTLYGKPFCWGWNSYGQLGDSTRSTRLTPVRVHTHGLSYAQVSAGAYHTCGVTTSHRAYCWGRNAYGALGDGTGSGPGSSEADRWIPTAVFGSRAYQQVKSGGDHTCALSTSNAAYCWGRNTSGQLGISYMGGRRLRSSPVSGGLQFSELSADGARTCGITTSHQAYCWGAGGSGALGAGDLGSTSTPVAVLGGLQFGVLSTGGNHTSGLSTDGQAYSWGWFLYTQPAAVVGPM